jgi:hypothetical protein
VSDRKGEGEDSIELRVENGEWRNKENPNPAARDFPFQGENGEIRKQGVRPENLET